MLLFACNGHTCVASHAMEEINAEALANTTDSAVRAMVDVFVRIILPELAHITIVFR